MFLVRSKLSITVYLSLVLYRSTSLQSLSFLKNIKTFWCKKKLANNCSIPSKQQPYNHDRFSKNIESFYSLTVTIVSQKYQELSVQVEKVNNRSIPSTHAERKITDLSD